MQYDAFCSISTSSTSYTFYINQSKPLQSWLHVILLKVFCITKYNLQKYVACWIIFWMLSKMCLLKRRVCRIFAKDHFCRCSVGKESCAWIHSKLLQRSFKNTLLYYVDRCRLPISIQNHDYIMCFHFQNVLLRVITVRMCFCCKSNKRNVYETVN